MKQNIYSVELILSGQGITTETIENQLRDLGRDIQINRQDDIENIDSFKIQINTEQPEIVFDTCSLFGRLSNIKVDEVK